MDFSWSKIRQSVSVVPGRGSGSDEGLSQSMKSFVSPWSGTINSSRHGRRVSRVDSEEEEKDIKLENIASKNLTGVSKDTEVDSIATSRR